MRTLNLYIMKQIVVGLLLVLTVMLAIVWLTQSLRLIDMIVTKGLSVWLFIRLTALLLPNFLVILLPIALFAVCLFVYNRMGTDKELAVACGAGLHPLRIAEPAIIIGIILALLSYVMTFKLVPESVIDFKELQWTIKNSVSHVLLQEGEFNQIGKGLTVYVRKRDDSGTMYGLLIHDQRGGRKETVIAERGMITGDSSNIKAVIENGSRQELDAKTGRFAVLYFDRYTMDFGTLGNGKGIRAKDTRELSFSELISALHEKPAFMIELNKRFVLPLYNICFAFLAVTLLIKGRYNRKGQTPKVIASALLMLLVESAQLGIENLSAKHLYLIPLMYLNALLPSVICLYVLCSNRPLGAIKNGLTSRQKTLTKAKT